MKETTESFHNQFDAAIEDTYNAYTAHRHLRNTRIAYAIFTLLYALFGITDYLLVPEWFSLFFAIRFFIVIPALLLTVALTFHPDYCRREQWILLASLIIGGGGIAVMLVLEPLNTTYFGGLFLVLTAGYFMLHLRACLAITGGITILAIFVAGVLLTDKMSLGVFSATLFLIAENIMGGIGSYQLERFRRNEFLKIHDLDQTRAQLEHDMIERNRYLEAVLQTSADGFLVIDAEEKILQVNDAYCRMSGYSPEELRQLTIKDIDARIHRIAESGSEIFETKHRRKDGSDFDVEVSTTFLVIGAGQLICFCRDITGRKQSEEKIRSLLAGKELLLKEVHHRIKNNLGTVSSLLDIQSQSAPPEVRGMFDVAINRVNSMVVLYDKLLSSEHYDSISCKSFLADIIDRLISFFPGTANVRIESQLEDFDLVPKKLFPLGIIVNEIVTNIMKYAFVGRESGLICIVLARNGDTATLAIQDDGVGLPDGFDAHTATGFGLMLVGMLAEQIDGTFTIHNGSGTRSVVSFSV